MIIIIKHFIFKNDILLTSFLLINWNERNFLHRKFIKLISIHLFEQIQTHTTISPHHQTPRTRLYDSWQLPNVEHCNHVSRLAKPLSVFHNRIKPRQTIRPDRLVLKRKQTWMPYVHGTECLRRCAQRDSCLPAVCGPDRLSRLRFDTWSISRFWL